MYGNLVNHLKDMEEAFRNGQDPGDPELVARSEAFLDLVQQADIIFGVDVETGARMLFYGTTTLDLIGDGIGPPVVLYVPVVTGNQAVWLAIACKDEKRYCELEENRARFIWDRLRDDKGKQTDGRTTLQ